MAFLKKAFLINSSALVCFVIRMAQTMLLSRWLGPASIGQYSLITSVLMLAGQVCALGLPIAYLYHSQHDPKQAQTYQTNVMWAGSLLGVVGGLATGMLLWGAEGYFGPVPGYACLAAGGYCLFMIHAGITRNSLMRRVQSKRLSSMTLLAAVGALGLVLLLVAWDKLTVGTALLCFVAMQMIRMAVGWFWVGPEVDFRIRPSVAVIKTLGRMGIRLGLVDIMVLLNGTVSVLIIKHLIQDFEHLGYFSRGLQVAMLVVTASQAVLPLLFSKWASLTEDQLTPHFEKVMRFVTTFSLVVILVIVLSAKWVILILYGPAFLPAVVPMMILLPGTVLYLLAKVIIQFLGSRGLPERAIGALMIAAGLSAALSYLIVPNYGIRGAALASTAGNFALLLMLMVLVMRKFDVTLAHCLWFTPMDVRTLFKRKA
jgi:O-antigen/teichoic acid export membrane protein